MRFFTIIIGILITEATMAQVTTRPARSVRIAVGQILCIDGDRDGNFRRIEYALEDARQQKAEIACFPESAILGWENPDAHRLATPIPGADSDRLARLAEKFGIMIAIGLDEKDGDKLYDSAILVDKSGKLLLKHRKINVLPELMDPPYATGKPVDIGAAETQFGRVGLMICADTFSDDHIRRMGTLKPDLVLVPYGWAAEIEKWPKHAKELEKLVCGISRAWRCPVVGTDLVGAISNGPWRGRTYGGASVIADGSGKPVAVLRDRDVDLQIVDLEIGRRATRR
jgi:predicted amidohydrolase